MIRKSKNGLYYLELVEFESGCSGAAIFEQLQQLRMSQDSACGNLLYSPIVYITTAIKVVEHILDLYMP
jgi:hypothetical protein